MTHKQRHFLRRVWDSVRSPQANRHSGHDVDHLVDLCTTLLSQRGEVSTARIAAEAIAAYGRLNDAGRSALFDTLANDYAHDAAELQRAIDAYQDAPSPLRASAIHQAAESRRQELIKDLMRQKEAAIRSFDEKLARLGHHDGAGHKRSHHKKGDEPKAPR